MPARAKVPRIKVRWTDASTFPPPRPKELAALAERVLRTEGLSGNVDLVFCENAYIRTLNRRFRKLDKTTDVLSFHYGDDDILGEIYIATEKAKKQAPRWKNTFFAELKRLVVHGSLHLAGYDHIISKDRRVMRLREDQYLASEK